MHVLCVAGARPNFMKIKPVMDSAEGRGLRTTLVHTGQHYNPELSDVFFDDLGLRPPDHHLEVGSGTAAEQVAKVMVAFEPLVERLRPDAVVVVGDVNSTLAASLVASRTAALVAHVEAGLRSRDWGMPEELNRTVTDRVSDLLFAPSEDAAENLRAEGFRDDQIHVVGNVMVDSLLANRSRALALNVADRLGVGDAYGVVTLHRPSNVDDREVFERLLGALGEIAKNLPLIFPVHPRTAGILKSVEVPPGIVLSDPLGYLDFLSVQSGARLVLTDSGGIQEETTMLGIPCLTLRTTTERPITISEGTNRLVGVDPEKIVSAAAEALSGTVSTRRPPLWDGRAGERIVDVLEKAGDDPSWRRPGEVAPL